MLSFSGPFAQTQSWQRLLAHWWTRKAKFNVVTLFYACPCKEKTSFWKKLVFQFLLSQNSLIDADWCPLMWLILIDVNWCWLMLTFTILWWSMLIDADLCWLMLSDAFWCWLMLIDEDWLIMPFFIMYNINWLMNI